MAFGGGGDYLDNLNLLAGVASTTGMHHIHLHSSLNETCDCGSVKNDTQACSWKTLFHQRKEFF